MSCRLLDCFSHVIVAVKVEYVGHEVERVLIVLNLGIQAGEVEAIGQIFFVYFAKVLIPSRGYKLYIVSIHLRFMLCKTQRLRGFGTRRQMEKNNSFTQADD